MIEHAGLLIELFLVLGVVGGLAVWDYLKTSKALEKTRAEEAAAKAKAEASETAEAP